MALTGLNPEQATSAITEINNAHGDIIVALINSNYNSFVSPMSAVWGSPQAVEFFKKYQTTIRNMQMQIQKTFSSVINAMNSAASNLSAIAGATWASTPLQWHTQEPIDVSCIKESINGVVGIDQAQATTIAAQLSTVLSGIQAGLARAVTAVRSSGFVGEGMQESLVSSLTAIESSISDTFDTLITDVNTAMQNTVDTYTTTSTNINSAFAGGES